MKSTDGCSNAAWLSGGVLGRILGVHGVHGRDILQLDWCGPCRIRRRFIHQQKGLSFISNRQWRKEGTFSASGLAGIEPTPARSNGAGYARLSLSATAVHSSTTERRNIRCRACSMAGEGVLGIGWTSRRAVGAGHVHNPCERACVCE